MIRTFLWSMKKSRRLQKIARMLTPKPDCGESLMRAFAEGGFDAIGARLDEVEEGKRQLFALVREDPDTGKVLKARGLSEADLAKLYERLVRGGAGVFTKGHWVPASSLAFGAPLDFVLRHVGDDDESFSKVCARLWHYFHYNEAGEISD